ncbi:ABC transporter substrate-binding protein [Saccharopolyspora rhizosphaerae]|uniref:ABC transporter substrate-binding protein n=1 Tax=Saccharopolyspora rhizosphaerae TaxID=2492662 RepID=A0A3R8VLC6_9PSEU|nr:ABC transporter substrate-binding protein [Saccharopolyspora rhizosphaerae]RRO19969.1 ABC transporter substrate-binding protein [Saccharopolyspora rhizosphaerae]
MPSPRPWAAIAMATLALSGCASAPPTGPPGEHAPEVAAADPAMARGAKGEVTICGVRDTGVFEHLTEEFNARGNGLSAHYVEIGQDTDSTRAQALQRLEGGSSECDIYITDVTWTSEWATQGWLLDHTKLTEVRRGELLPNPLETVRYDGRDWAVPFFTNAGLLFYRDDRVPEPKTWSEVYAQAGQDRSRRVEMQAKRYEGLTVNFLELLYSAGGSVIDESGRVTVDSPETRKVLRLMTQGLENGAIDRACLTYDEDYARRAYESGAAGYLRQWPSAHKLVKQTDTGPVTKAAPLPAFDEHSKPAAVLGGWNLAIAAGSDNPGAAVALVDFATSAEFQRQMVLRSTQAPVYAALYDDPQVRAELPFIPQLKESLLQAKPRPVSPVYAQVSRAIYNNVYAVISGQTDVESGVREMAADVEKAQETY